MSKFKVGDVVRCNNGADGQGPYFKAGDVGSVLEDSDVITFVDFNGHGNAEVFEEGKWMVATPKLELVTPA